MSLGTDFTSELKSIYDLLFSLFDLSQSISSLESHLQVEAHNFKNLLVG